MLVDKVCEEILRKLDVSLITEDVCVGLRYTYAVVRAGSKRVMGVAYTPLEDLSGCSSIKEYPDANSVPEMLRSHDILKRTVAIAFLNAISSLLFTLPEESVGRDPLDVVELDPSDTVVFVGYIGPIINQVKNRVGKVFILERNPIRRRDVLSDAAAPRIVPLATKLFITGATLVNDTIDYILSLKSKDVTTILVGATAGLPPSLLFRAGIDVVSSFRILENQIDNAARCLKLGCGTRELYRYGYKYTITKNMLV